MLNAPRGRSTTLGLKEALADSTAVVAISDHPPNTPQPFVVIDSRSGTVSK